MFADDVMGAGKSDAPVFRIFAEDLSIDINAEA